MNLLNTQIREYTLLRELSRGTNSVVYYAKNQLGAEVAIKVMEGDANLDVENLRKHFRQQAQLLVALKHEYITQVYDFYEDDRCVAIIMEYLNGESLESYMAAHPVTEVAKVVRWYSQVLPAFEKAHQMGVVHRDVNPSMLFVTKSGNMKILSFGTAKIVQDALAESLAGGMKTIIRPDVPYYKSPELITRPKSADQGTDIYSLGVLFYVLTTGVEPYDKQNLLDDIIYKTIPKPHFYSQELYDVVARAAAKQRKDRFANCLEFLEALQSAGVNHNESGPGRRIKHENTSTGFKPGKTEIIQEGPPKKPESRSGSATVIINDHSTYSNQSTRQSYQQSAANSTSSKDVGPPPIGAAANGREGFELDVGNEVFSLLQMRTAAILGGPAVFGYFMSENFKVFKEYDKSSKTMTIAIIATLAYYLFSALSETYPLFGFLILGSWGYMFWLANEQVREIRTFIDKGGKYKPIGTVLIAYLVNIAIMILISLKFS
ncbi:serine/threonine-protein kinase [Dyadobacter sp. Leaf189]|uniref:serine/threonine protein kinase n=1 Tax=Dyadobacter sp. Leaf189 TaxID=1736295 RepID=UPI0006F7E992|nr:serine/threonine-protein kinase [Dyadobacter sp. Leaf189]KQS33825.1 hypothetical protein ASG33_07195 [Dyadobacter sp. Leaf189]